MPKTAARNAFSLIELLVVISIITILAAILLPAIRLVRVQAEAMVCASHLRQVGLCLSAYLPDNQGLVPYALDAKGQHWYELLASYAEVSDKDNVTFNDAGFANSNILVGCTAYKRDAARPWRIGYGYTKQPLMPDSTMTLMYSAADAKTGKWSNASISRITQRSIRPVLACSDEWTLGVNEAGPAWKYGANWGPHKKERNCLTYDLHIERLHSTSLIKRLYDPSTAP